MLRMSCLSIGCAVGMLLSAACDKDKDGSPAAGRHETPVLCTRCNTTNVLHLARPAGEESWPKKCPSCSRSGAYASETCPSCGAPVPLVDPRTRGYGRPTACPGCGKSMQASPTAP